MKAKITYRGWPGHYICSDRCLFRLNTLIEHGNAKIVVSTVGRMRSLNGKQWEQIGLDRHYETMAFHAEKKGGFWDADVSREVSFRSAWSYKNLGDEALAQEGHERVVAEIAERLEQGEIFLEEEYA